MLVDVWRPAWTGLAELGCFTGVVGAWVLWQLGAHAGAYALGTLALALGAAPVAALALGRRRVVAPPTAARRRTHRLVLGGCLGLAIAAFFAWGVHFIELSSTRGPDGRVYYSLFDDAMITMRYAWNFTHGAGCVWNPGERLEGFTSPLMMFLMSGATAVFDKSYAVLAVQVTGLALVVVTAFFTRRIAEQLFARQPRAVRRGLSAAVFVATLFYYPLPYWSLLGMETSLLAALAAAATATLLERGRDRRVVLGLPILCGLLFWTRPDALVQVTLLLAVRAFMLGRAGLGIALREVALAAVLVAANVGLRLAYYGEWLPNTYVLKLTGLPLGARLRDGAVFVGRFLEHTWLLFALSGVGLALAFQCATVAVVALPVSVVVYQVWVGGDPWLYWRIPAPYVPMLFAAARLGIVAPFDRLRGWLERRREPLGGGALLSVEASGACAVVALGVLLCRADSAFLAQQTFRQPAYLTGANHKLVGIGVALARLAKPEARLGVLWAGVIPYYAGALGVDFLGKTDARIARLPADPNAGFSGMRSVPGHNKYDLKYSIAELRPDYVQKTRWFRHDLTAFVRANYVEAEGLWLLKGSPNIRWELLGTVAGIAPEGDPPP
ncbi:MAG: hypothetical protein IT373_02750 [Polyangiaceae bacterium]|nr:hypothetical protein [Polyangiaceae bacterium]